jgi:hypothetical protein
MRTNLINPAAIKLIDDLPNRPGGALSYLL